MINNEIIEQYKSGIGKEISPYIEKALKIYHRIDPAAELISIETAKKIKQIASELYLQDKSKKKSKKEFSYDLSPEGFITSSEELKRIRPTLDDLRQEVFNNKKPPFKDLDQALCWIKKEAGKGIKNKKLSKLKHLSIAGKDFIFAPGIPLDILAVNTDFLSQRTRFIQDSLIIYILTGIEPIARIYTIKKGKFIELKIYRSLTEKESNSLFRKIKQSIKPARKKFTEKHLRLYRFFEKHGYPPTKEKMKFWEEKYKEWNKENPKNKKSSPDVLRISYHRLKRLLEK
jgi:hypothetical protein